MSEAGKPDESGVPDATPEAAVAAPEPAVVPPASVPAGPKPRVMIVEDVGTTRTLLMKILTNAGYDVIEVANAEDAIKLYHEYRPDAVTMDVFLDKISGVGALQVILRIDPNARVVMCSSQHDSGFIQETKRLGARGYLRKPFEPQAVRDAVATALK
jgi:two-component system chemotaxis response regulator CheY